MKTITLIRHTAPDIQTGICYGQLDMGVSDSFEKEAEQVANWTDSTELIITSPLRRASQLADHLSALQGCPVITDARLMEMHFGDWEGQYWNDISRDEIDAWAADILHYAPPNGESSRQLLHRLENFITSLTALPQRQIMVVAHAGSIRALLSIIGHQPIQTTLNWKIEYGSVCYVRLTA